MLGEITLPKFSAPPKIILSLLSGINNIFLGSNTGGHAITANNCVVIGANAMSIGDSSNVIIIGNHAGQNNSTDNNIFIGAECGFNNTSGTNNLFVGTNSGYTNTIGYSNIFMGYNAGYTNDGNFNLFFGFHSVTIFWTTKTAAFGRITSVRRT